MERIVYKKTLDVHKNGIQFTLQGFETADIMARRIEISLMASGDTIDLPLEQIVAMMYVTTPSATEPSINECTIKGNTIIYDVLPIVEEGITEMQIKLIDTRAEGANGVLAAPKFAIEVTESNTNDEGATQTTTYTALEDAVSKAKGVYDSRLVRIEIDKDCTFRAIYADGTIYESTALNETLLKGEAILSQSYARGGTGSRNGEDTDNSLYYSNVSKSASASANKANVNAAGVLKEVQKHGVYTAFSVDFNTGEVKYISPSYTFNINENTGELEAYGEDYNADDVIHTLVTEWLENETAVLDEKLIAEGEARVSEDTNLRVSIESETIAREQADIDLISYVDNAKSEAIASAEELAQTAKEEAIAESDAAFAKNFNEIAADYIVEQGSYKPDLYSLRTAADGISKEAYVSGQSNATWYYNKWKSGRIEIDGGIYVSFENGINIDKDIHYINKMSPMYGYPCALTEHPHITLGMGYVGNHGQYWAAVNQFQAHTQICTPQYLIFTTATEVNEGADGAHICVHIVGRWK